METSKILLQADNSNNEEIAGKAGAGNLIKSLLVIFMLLMITLMSSCMVPGPGSGPGPGHERHGRSNERHGNNDNRGHGDRHDDNDHHNN